MPPHGPNANWFWSVIQRLLSLILNFCEIERHTFRLRYGAGELPRRRNRRQRVVLEQTLKGILDIHIKSKKAASPDHLLSTSASERRDKEENHIAGDG